MKKNIIRNIVWSISGILLMAILVLATTTITDTGINTPSMIGNIINFSSYDASLKIYAKEHSLFGNDNGESIEFHNIKADSKAYIGWYGFDLIEGYNTAIGWFGCHYNGTAGIHSHCSIETLDDNGMNTKFAVSYGSQNDYSIVGVYDSHFEIANLMNASRTGKTKFTPYTTFEVYPNNQDTYGLKIDSDTRGAIISTLGTSNVTIDDNLVINKNLFVYGCIIYNMSGVPQKLGTCN